MLFSKKFLAVFLIFFLTSCTLPVNWWKPHGYRVFRQMPKGGTPGFNLGWIHGCQSGLGSQFAGAFYMTFYTWSRDPDITSVNPDIAKIKERYKKELRGINWNNQNDIKKNFSDYNTIFWGAHLFCRHATLGILQTAAMDPKLPGQDRHNWEDHSLGNVWKMNGKGDTRYGAGGLW